MHDILNVFHPDDYIHLPMMLKAKKKCMAGFCPMVYVGFLVLRFHNAVCIETMIKKFVKQLQGADPCEEMVENHIKHCSKDVF